MPDENDQLSFSETGYQTPEDEAAARLEEGEYFRRRLLRGIRGHLRDVRGFRWGMAYLLVTCAVLAWLFVVIPATAHIGVIWRSGLAVLATWPIYVAALFFWAKVEGRRLNMAGHWDTLLARDREGELADNAFSDNIDGTFDKDWWTTRYLGQDALPALLMLAIASVGTWLIWDLIRMGTPLMAEIILDGVIVPIYPEIKNRMPSNPWYETAFFSTTLHFAGAAFITIVCVTVWKYSHLPH
jgi:hypothetical protein